MGHITFTARVVGQPKQVTAGGKKKLEIRAAENHRRRTEAGEWATTGTTWHDVELWEAAAQTAATQINDKDVIVVIGDQVSKAYQDKEGKQRENTFITNATVALYRKAHSGSEPAEDAPAPQKDTDVDGWSIEADEAWKQNGPQA